MTLIVLRHSLFSQGIVRYRHLHEKRGHEAARTLRVAGPNHEAVGVTPSSPTLLEQMAINSRPKRPTLPVDNRPDR